MSVAVLKLEDETLVAFNLNMVSSMEWDNKGITFVHNGNIYSIHPEYDSKHRKLNLHSSVKCEKGEIKPFSAEAMFEAFCNL